MRSPSFIALLAGAMLAPWALSGPASRSADVPASQPTCEVLYRWTFEQDPLEKNIHAVTWNVGEPFKPLGVSFTDGPGYDGTGRALQTRPAEDYQIILRIDGLRDRDGQFLQVTPDLYLAVCLRYDPPAKRFLLSLWNVTRGKGQSLELQTRPGQWNVLRIPLLQGKYVSNGDRISRLTLTSKGQGLRDFTVDNLLICRGRDTTAPEPVRNLTVRRDDRSVLLDWPAAGDNVLVRQYHIYRGTVPDFPQTPRTRIGIVHRTHFTDDYRLWENGYHYAVRAEDLAGNLAPPGRTHPLPPAKAPAP